LPVAPGVLREPNVARLVVERDEDAYARDAHDREVAQVSEDREEVARRAERFGEVRQAHQQRLVLAQRAPLRLAHGRLRAAALRDVGRDADDADETAALVVYGGVAHLRGEGRAVAASHVELARPRLARRDAPHYFGGLPGRVFGGRDFEYVSPDGLGRAPTVELLGVAVPVGDRPLGVGGDDGLLHGVEQVRLEAHRVFG